PPVGGGMLPAELQVEEVVERPGSPEPLEVGAHLVVRTVTLEDELAERLEVLADLPADEGVDRAEREGGVDVLPSGLLVGEAHVAEELEGRLHGPVTAPEAEPGAGGALRLVACGLRGRWHGG